MIKSTVRLLNGSMSEWNELMTDWELARDEKPLNKIEPLV